ncbi:anaphase-promoting complex subunit 10 [Pancytospora epiphaga]|nr:anaphase-promoting complex subunit 10 [Pancytospora epiphaga]
MEVELSSNKNGYGIDELRTENETEYWCTDSNLPHFIRFTFPSRTYVHSVCIDLSYRLDESYTPESVVLLFNGRKRPYKLKEPEGIIPLHLDSIVSEIVLLIISNHSEGRDSHVRGLKVMANQEHEILWNSE